MIPDRRTQPGGTPPARGTLSERARKNTVSCSPRTLHGVVAHAPARSVPPGRPRFVQTNAASRRTRKRPTEKAGWSFPEELPAFSETRRTVGRLCEAMKMRRTSIPHQSFEMASENPLAVRADLAEPLRYMSFTARCLGVAKRRRRTIHEESTDGERRAESTEHATERGAAAPRRYAASRGSASPDARSRQTLVFRMSRSARPRRPFRLLERRNWP